jgi:hypothetical protein
VTVALAVLAMSAGCTKDSVLGTTTPSPPLVPLHVSTAPRGATGGTPVAGRLLLTVAAPPGGATASLRSDTPAARVPSSVAVPAGATSVAFPIETSVPVSDAVATITADVNGTSASGTLALWRPAQNEFFYDGYLGNFVGQGRLARFTPANATIEAGSDRNQINIRVSAAGGEWSAEMAAPSGTPLRPGVYAFGPPSRFGPTDEAVMSFGGEGRGCQTTGGQFEVHEVNISPAGRVFRFRATFDYRCASNQAGETSVRGGVTLTNP